MARGGWGGEVDLVYGTETPGLHDVGTGRMKGEGGLGIFFEEKRNNKRVRKRC
jgi:hypothetical protein